MEREANGENKNEGTYPGGAPAARRLVCLNSGDYLGVEGRPVEVQVDLCRRGDGSFNIVGLPGTSRLPAIFTQPASINTSSVPPYLPIES